MKTATQRMSNTGPPERTGREPEGAPVPLAMTFEELLGGDRSPDEDADDIIRAVREMRDAASPRSVD